MREKKTKERQGGNVTRRGIGVPLKLKMWQPWVDGVEMKINTLTKKVFWENIFSLELRDGGKVQQSLT